MTSALPDESLEASYARLAHACGVRLASCAITEDCCLIRELRQYGDNAYKTLLDANPSVFPSSASIDFAFPGAGYFSVACGGFWDVLSRAHTVRSSSGASGGACSSFMLLAGGCDAPCTFHPHSLLATHLAELSVLTELLEHAFITQLRRRAYCRDGVPTFDPHMKYMHLGVICSSWATCYTLVTRGLP